MFREQASKGSDIKEKRSYFEKRIGESGLRMKTLVTVRYDTNYMALTPLIFICNPE